MRTYGRHLTSRSSARVWTQRLTCNERRLRPHTTRLWSATLRKISIKAPPSGRDRHLCCIAFHSQRRACTRGAALHSCSLYARPFVPRDFGHTHGPSFWPSSYYCHSARPFHLATLDVDPEESSYPSQCADVGSTSRRRLLSLKLLRPASSICCTVLESQAVLSYSITVQCPVASS